MPPSNDSAASLATVGLVLVLTFGLSWAYTGAYELYLAASVTGTTLGRILPNLAAWGPLVATLAVVGLAHGDVRAWVSERVVLRNPLRLYLLALVLPNAVSTAAMLVVPATGHSLAFDASPTNFVLVFAFTFLLLGALEEFGWRGYLQPALESYTNPVVAACLVGILWGVWHLPSYRLGYLGDMNLWLFLLHLLPMSVVMAWLAHRSTGILPVMTLHAAHNAPGNVLTAVGDVPATVGALYYPTYTALWLLVGGLLVGLAGRDLGPITATRITSTDSIERLRNLPR